MEPNVVTRTLRVDGQLHDMTADPDSPLLLALRNDLGLNGAKVGCALSQRGVCTVPRDGEPIRAWVTTVREATGAVVTPESRQPASGSRSS